jgi:acetylornithine/N-succinyldiaminopimelate aminotransferase
MDGFDTVPFGDLDAVKAAIGPQTGAIMIEPIQGEGGIRVADPEFLRSLRALCDNHGLLLIFDEVQTGVGRVGKLFAYELSGAVPDIMAIAKGIGGGFPLGAFLATREAAKGMTLGTHGTTYGGNPLATSVGGAVLDVVLREGFLDHVASMGLKLKQGLAGLKESYPDVIAGVRGEGLMLGVETVGPVAEFAAAARAEKLIVIPASDNVARLLPPLVITDDDVAEGLRRLGAACVRLQRIETAAAAQSRSGAAG